MRLVEVLLIAGVLLGLGGCALLQEHAPEAPRFKSPSLLYEKALEYYQSGRYAQARDLFHQYVGQYPDSLLYPAALYELAYCYQMLGDAKEAMALFNRLVTAYGDQDFWGAQAMARIRQIQAY